MQPRKLEDNLNRIRINLQIPFGVPGTIIRSLVFILILLLASISIRTVSAQEVNPDPPSDDEVNAIAKELYCPVCENTPLDVCPTQACEEWRQLIYDKLALGWDEEQIKSYFSEQYGDRVLAAPPHAVLTFSCISFPRCCLPAVW